MYLFLCNYEFHAQKQTEILVQTGEQITSKAEDMEKGRMFPQVLASSLHFTWVSGLILKTKGTGK